jgi:hypothetical protein
MPVWRTDLILFRDLGMPHRTLAKLVQSLLNVVPILDRFYQ